MSDYEDKIIGIIGVDGPRDRTVKVSERDGKFYITVSQMYEYVEFPLSALIEIRDALGVKNVDFGDRDFSSGCESCDYGSNYSVELIAYN